MSDKDNDSGIPDFLPDGEDFGIPGDPNRPGLPARRGRDLPPREKSVFMSSLEDWLAGKTSKPPEGISAVLEDANEKLASWAVFNILDSLPRLLKLNKYILSIEERIFDEDDLKGMDMADLLHRHESAVNAQRSVLEFARKFMQQNKDALKHIGKNKEDEAIMRRLKSLDREQVNRMLDLIESGATASRGSSGGDKKAE